MAAGDPTILSDGQELGSSATKTFREWRLIFRAHQVNVPKTRRTYCKSKDCRKHTQHKVTQYKAGKVNTTLSHTGGIGHADAL